jgi:hypothetical protein
LMALDRCGNSRGLFHDSSSEKNEW